MATAEFRLTSLPDVKASRQEAIVNKPDLVVGYVEPAHVFCEPNQAVINHYDIGILGEEAVCIEANVRCNPIDVAKCRYAPLPKYDRRDPNIVGNQSPNHVGKIRPAMHDLRAKFSNRSGQCSTKQNYIQVIH